MNRLILPALSILLAATSVPALAQRDGGGRGEGRAPGAQQQQQDRPQQRPQAQQQQRPQAQPQGRGNDPANFERAQRDRSNAQTLEQNRNAYPNRSGRIEQQQPRPQPPVVNRDTRPDLNRPDFSDNRRFDRDRDARNMRNFQRNWTAQQRFRVGVYFGPPNFTYRRWSWGQFLPRPYYVSNYWISNWAFYGLDFPPPGTRWVRYGPDALLIDTWNGEILQVAYNIFY